MKTNHRLFHNDSRDLSFIETESVDLIITSPPYPMIEMWDGLYAKLNPEIEELIKSGNGNRAFRYMHNELDMIWRESYRVLKEGGIACINVGDATRTLDRQFRLYSNHSRILSFCKQ